MKQYAPSCDRNKHVILDVLKNVVPASGDVLEIGSGTGQHVAFFANALPQLTWQPTDTAANLPSINAWRQDANTDNIRKPLVLDLDDDSWPVIAADVLVCINIIHIISWPLVEKLFVGAGKFLRPGGLFYAYGPYRYADQPLAASNVEFDAWLKNRDPQSGIRQFEEVDRLAQQNGLTLEGDTDMPANNRSLWWRKL